MAAYLYEGGFKLRQKVRAIVVNNSGEFLLVRPHGYRDDEWTLAGGGVEEGETVHQAMRREIAKLAACCHGDDRPDCPILDDLSAPIPTRRVKRRLSPSAAKG